MVDVTPLLQLQNPDGGWAYKQGTSCAEPTVLALLALTASGKSTSEAAVHAASWLAQSQRADGGWAPRAGVDLSTWVTALALLLPQSVLPMRREAALTWLTRWEGRENSWPEQLRQILISGSTTNPAGHGFPWFPNTAAWVTPTCFAVLALAKNADSDRGRFEKRRKSATEYLLAHRCADGGWNHGSSKALGYDSDSYPETTGQALLALHSLEGASVETAIRCAQNHATRCRSAEAFGWLTLGLLTHRVAPPVMPAMREQRSVSEISLHFLGVAAREGNNVFVA